MRIGIMNIGEQLCRRHLASDDTRRCFPPSVTKIG